MSTESSASDSDVVYDKCRNRHRKRCKTSEDKSLVIVESSAGALKLQQKIGTGGGRPRDLEVPNAQLEAVSKMLSTHLDSTSTLLVQTQMRLDQVLKELDFLKYAVVANRPPEAVVLPQSLLPIAEAEAVVLPQSLLPIAEEEPLVEVVPTVEAFPDEVDTLPVAATPETISNARKAARYIF
jgi:hypothetical protein